jgi:hypothetical protein
MISRKKGVHFFGKGYCKKCMGMKQQRKKEQKRIYCKIKMPIIFIKGSCVETPLYTMCWINKDGDKYENRGRRGGGGADTRREGLKEHSV